MGLEIDGRRVICGQRPTVLDPNLDDVSAAYPQFIILNPRRMANLPTSVKLWVHAHACGYQFRGPDGRKADCFAAQRGRTQYWLTPKGLDEVCRYIAPTRASQQHAAGPERCRLMQACYSERDPVADLSLALASHERKLGAPPGDAPDYILQHYKNYTRLHGTAAYAEAEGVAERLIAVAAQVHVRFSASVIDDLAGHETDAGRHAQADALYARALAVREASLPPGHAEVVDNVRALGGRALRLRRWQEAYDHLKKAIAIRTVAQERDSPERRAFWNRLYWDLALATWQRAQPSPNMEVQAEAFLAVQLSRESSTAQALSQASARFASGSGDLAKLVREHQDLAAAMTRIQDAAFRQAMEADPKDAYERAKGPVNDVRGRLTALEARIAKEFPEFADLSNPKPLGLAEVRAQLRPNEALVAYASSWDASDENMFVWAITADAVAWKRLNVGVRSLALRVFGLRCGLDASLWDERQTAGWCQEILGLRAGDLRPTVLPYDLGTAHELYRTLLEPVEDVVRGKRLIIVPSGPLTALPFQVLVSTRSPARLPAGVDGYAEAAWLAKGHAITVLPSVASLRALRQFAKTSKATRSFIGFGNPLLLGPQGNDRRAWGRQDCSTSPRPVQIASRAVRSGIPRFFRGGLANIDHVRAQEPLPETADELCAVARSSGADASSVFLGEKASETAIKAFSADGTLAQARVVHFATHGLLAGETELLSETNAEPALVLTPPQTATEEDDGLLTASEIAQLKLDADWVVLSACNTAAGESDKPGAEALSGLARAFFYAGARSILVSHWAVDSEATVMLITKAFGEIEANAKIGRAEALRRSMQAVMRAGGRHAHPAVWAPFVVVGEGGG